MGMIRYSDYLNLMPEDFKVYKLNSLQSPKGKRLIDAYFKSLDEDFYTRVCTHKSCSINTMRELVVVLSETILSERIISEMKYYLKSSPTEGIEDIDVFNALSCLENISVDADKKLVVSVKDSEGNLVKKFDCVGLVKELDQFFYYKQLNEELARLSILYSKTTIIPNPRKELRQRLGNYFTALLLLYSIEHGVTTYSELQGYYSDIYLLSVALEKKELTSFNSEDVQKILQEYHKGTKTDEGSLKSFNREVLRLYRDNDFSVFLFTYNIVADIEKYGWSIPACREKIVAAVYGNRQMNKAKRERIQS